ncbi:hypothetical protein CR513_30045, partial [Mucuna pruriens]
MLDILIGVRRKKVFEEGDLVVSTTLSWVYLRKERFLNLRKSKLLSRGNRPFKILRKINDNAYVVDMPQEHGYLETARATVKATRVVDLHGFHGLVEFRKSDPP